VALARLLFVETRLWVLDEPITNLDVTGIALVGPDGASIWIRRHDHRCSSPATADMPRRHPQRAVALMQAQSPFKLEEW